MEQLKCIIVEDEPIAAEILENYIAQVPFLNLVDKVTDAIYALELLQKTSVDVMFLDIHLPGLKGLDLLKILRKQPQVILTTAYREYALDGYDLAVVDYLLKPIQFNRFLAAVNKLALPGIKSIVENPVEKEQPVRRHIFVNINKKNIRIYLDEIVYIESQREYIKIVTERQPYLVKYQLTDFEILLGSVDFIRVHRSFIVSKPRIRAYTATEIEMEAGAIPIGRNFKELVFKALENPIS
ncbi:LytR/AlgR family response regulator transcription factor [Niabella hibiscisoli]|uniref:LytR/AlgR family response regulator transcription factor n=1 Tax=Niabella hibiscisoli TaxID=1825928 RepID=UPI001F0E06C7|nr:LytTR family DNA-binding domain-containing protein [Niabella hibiscisoli]MCH5719158.1 LytTR family DNA-binding domain-containing protein [Niabella hibiscisoli]